METKQYSLCEAVLRRLHDAGVLDGLVVAGSWCVMFYQAYFDRKIFAPTIRTRDLDFVVPIPAGFGKKADVARILDGLGFVVDYRGEQGYMRFMHPDLILEFLVPERGRGGDDAFDIPALGVNAQPLRFLDLSLAGTITLEFRGIPVRLPHPVRFALHKLIVAQRRDNADKSERDRAQAMLVLNAVIESGESATIPQLYSSLPRGWRRMIDASLIKAGSPDLINTLGM